MTLPDANANRQLEIDVGELTIDGSTHPGGATGVADADWLPPDPAAHLYH